MINWIIFSILFVATHVGLYKLFEKAGYKGWQSLVPFYNAFIWLKIIKKPLWWFLFVLFPFINVFMLFLMLVELAKCFGKYLFWEQAASVLLPFVYLPYIGFNEKEKYRDPDTAPKIKKSVIREWSDAIIFAVVAATIIRTFLIEAFTIPTSSMEKSLLVGDFLFVSKFSYGPKIPNTPISFPFAHHTLPLTKDTKSFLEWIKLPYFRFPGLTDIKNNDVVVFNYPDGDTVALKMQDRSYYALVREYGWTRVNMDKGTFGDVVARPVDKRENYIKRCIGIPGDKLEIKNKQVFINGVAAQNPEEMQYQYFIKTDGSEVNERNREKLNITDRIVLSNDAFIYAMTNDVAKQIKEFKNVLNITQMIDSAPDPSIFPYSPHYKWNRDNFGPIQLPKAGMTVQLDTVNIALYTRIIDVYEGNDLAIKDGKIYINGKEEKNYTFKLDYYWMMGDNRHNSADSRYWGFVPIDHIVGKAVFIWLSIDQNKSLFSGIRWNRLFKFIH